jgi:hypothetical protein
VAEETGADSGDIEPWVTANAIMGVHQALIACTRRRIVDGARPARLAREVQAQADRALARLGRGLDGYAVKRPAGWLTGPCAIRDKARPSQRRIHQPHATHQSHHHRQGDQPTSRSPARLQTAIDRLD